MLKYCRLNGTMKEKILTDKQTFVLIYPTNLIWVMLRNVIFVAKKYENIFSLSRDVSSNSRKMENS